MKQCQIIDSYLLVYFVYQFKNYFQRSAINSRVKLCKSDKETHQRLWQAYVCDCTSTMIVHKCFKQFWTLSVIMKLHVWYSSWIEKMCRVKFMEVKWGIPKSLPFRFLEDGRMEMSSVDFTISSTQAHKWQNIRKRSLLVMRRLLN